MPLTTPWCRPWHATGPRSACFPGTHLSLLPDHTSASLCMTPASPDYVSVPGSHLLPSYQNPCFFFVELCTSVTTFRGAWTRATREVLSSARPPTKVCKTSNLDRQEVDKVEGQMCTIYERYMEIAVESFVHRCLKIEPSVRK